MRFKHTNINPNEQRLFPFVGGLVLGGVAGSAFNNRYNYYPYPMYQQPIYYQTNYPIYSYPYTTQASAPQVNIYNPYVTDKVIYEQPQTYEVNDTYTRGKSNSLDFASIKDVPSIDTYRSDML